MALYYFECFEPLPGRTAVDIRQTVGASSNKWLELNPTDQRVLIAGKTLGFGSGFPSYVGIWKLDNFGHLDKWLARFAEPDVVNAPELQRWGTVAAERSAAIYADLGEELPMRGVR